MAAAGAQVEAFRNALRGAGQALREDAWQRLVDALEDDFNTAAALSVLHEWRASGQVSLLRRGLEVFGLGSLAESETAPAAVRALAERRLEARSTREFEAADRLRAEIEAAGWEVRDVEAGFELVPRR
nr:hypothetical protein [Actinomycetota bacterium]